MCIVWRRLSLSTVKDARHYHKIINGNHSNKTPTKTPTNFRNNITPNLNDGNLRNPNISYVAITSNNPNNSMNMTEDTNDILTQFLNKFRVMFN